MIQTTRLLLRPMRPDDADDLLAIFADPVAMASFGGVLFDRPQMVRWVRRNLEHQERYGYGLFAVIHRADRRLIGDCGLEHLEIDGPEVELGYDIRSDYWGRGLATEAAAAVRDYALRELNLQRLISLIRHGNAASRRVAEKIGMRHVEDVTRHGHGYWLYALTREAEGGDAGDPRESESSRSPDERRVRADGGLVRLPVLDERTSADGHNAAGPEHRRQPHDPDQLGQPVGLFHGWWRGDPQPAPDRAPGLVVEAVANPAILAALTNAEPDALRARIRQGHRPWLATLEGEPAGWGWVATTTAAIPALDRALALPAGNRYLWDFVTLPHRRGRGIYRALLDTILRRDTTAARFWIGHDIGNAASASGIAKAGFRPVGTVYRLATGALVLVSSGDIERATAASELIGIPLPERRDESSMS